MTVSELIEQLRMCPQDAEVWAAGLNYDSSKDPLEEIVITRKQNFTGKRKDKEILVVEIQP